MDPEYVIYSLNVSDIQDVAMQELDREMTDEEIEKLQDMIADRIPWYEAICEAINELLEKDQNGDDHDDEDGDDHEDDDSDDHEDDGA